MADLDWADNVANRLKTEQQVPSSIDDVISTYGGQYDRSHSDSSSDGLMEQQLQFTVPFLNNDVNCSNSSHCDCNGDSDSCSGSGDTGSGDGCCSNSLSENYISSIISDRVTQTLLEYGYTQESIDSAADKLNTFHNDNDACVWFLEHC